MGAFTVVLAALRATSTGSIASARAPLSNGLPPESDLIYARAAIANVLGRDGHDRSAPWENPRTGTRGTVTAIKDAHTLVVEWEDWQGKGAKAEPGAPAAEQQETMF